LFFENLSRDATLKNTMLINLAEIIIIEQYEDSILQRKWH